MGDAAMQRNFRLRDEAELGEFRQRGLIFDEGTANYLGVSYLARYLVTFDFPGKKLYLKRGAQFGAPMRYDLSGMELFRKKGTATIRLVKRYSAADRAGLRSGDIVEEIDSLAAASVRLHPLREALSMPGEHAVRIRRGDKRLRVVLTLTDPPTRR